MLQLIYEICQEIKNYFIKPEEDIHSGTFTISSGELTDVDFLLDGQYFRVVGSYLNDGVYQYPASNLNDETFDGAVWAMRLPPAFIALAAEIEAWNDKYSAKVNTPFQSESLVGVYSYTKATPGGASDSNGVITWRSQFASQLNRWRRLSIL